MPNTKPPVTDEETLHAALALPAKKPAAITPNIWAPDQTMPPRLPPWLAARLG